MKYKVKINHIVPDLAKEDIYRHKCYLGVSINNPFFWGEHLSLFLAWIEKRFPFCQIVIGDHLHRINEYILHGKEGEDAIQSGIEKGNQLEFRIKKALEALDQDKFYLKRWQPFYEDPNIREVKSFFEKKLETDPAFNEEIYRSCKDFLDRQIKNGRTPKIQYEAAVHLSSQYLLEEMAVFNYLIGEGYKVQVYPGTQLHILKELALGKFSSFSQNLNEGIYMDLTVKKVKK